MFLSHGENDTPFGGLKPNEKYAFGYDLLRLFRARQDQTIHLTHAEDVWWRMYRANKYLGIRPWELDLVPIEDLDVLLKMRDYDVDAQNKRIEENRKKK